MYSACIFCHARLGENEDLPSFPVGRRIAFDAKRGRLWVVCQTCGRWNLTPNDERWEAIEECERRFRGTHLRVSTDHIGLAQLPSGLELVRIGPALLPEIAAWRYGSRLIGATPLSRPPSLLVRAGRLAARSGLAILARSADSFGLDEDFLLRMRTLPRGRAVLTRGTTTAGGDVVIRLGHLHSAELVRPEREQPWQLEIEHDRGRSTLADANGLRVAGSLLAAMNFGAPSPHDVRRAVARLDEAVDGGSYFSRVATIALRTAWGRTPSEAEEAARDARGTPVAATLPEQLAVRLTARSFWARGGTGSSERLALARLPAIDRLALEMAAHEEMERRALEGELAALEAAWRDAEEIAEIADGLLSDDVLVEEFKRRLGG